MSPLDRLRALRDRLLAMDSGSGEASDLALALAVVDAAQAMFAPNGDAFPDDDQDYDDSLSLERALDALTTAKPQGG